MKTISQLRLEAKDDTLPQIYCDMDMVLVDFLGGANEAMKAAGLDARFDDKGQHNQKDKKWDALKQTPKFWANLKPMPDAMTLWKYIKKHDPYILSTPSERMPSSKPEKREWIKKHLGSVSQINLVPREDKQEFALDSEGRPAVLIDDYIKNIKEWESKGGIGILHKNALSTIQQLKKLGY